jgi:hypothetical protein
VIENDPFRRYVLGPNLAALPEAIAAVRAALLSAVPFPTPPNASIYTASLSQLFKFRTVVASLALTAAVPSEVAMTFVV